MALVIPPRSPTLAPFVASLAYYELTPPQLESRPVGPGPSESLEGMGPSSRERVLPAGSTALMINLHEDELRTYNGADDDARVHRVSGAALGGPRSAYTVIDTREQRCIVSVNFTLGGARPFFGVPLSAVTDQLVGLDGLWGRDGAVLRERLLETPAPAERLRIVEDALLEHMTDPLEPDPAVARAAAALDRGCSVSDVTSLLGWLPGRLVRRFRDRIGLGPKRYARIRRLQRTLGTVVHDGDADWARVAVTHGYYDQAHLINDFRELTGLTPTTYRPRNAAEHNHVPLEDGPSPPLR